MDQVGDGRTHSTKLGWDTAYSFGTSSTRQKPTGEIFSPLLRTRRRYANHTTAGETTALYGRIEDTLTKPSSPVQVINILLNLALLYENDLLFSHNRIVRIGTKPFHSTLQRKSFL